MSDETTTPGTEPVQPVAGGASGDEPTTGVTQEKYEALLNRLTPLEEKARQADELQAKINQMMAERAGQGAPPANPQPDAIAADIEAFEQQLLWTAKNGETEAERRAANYMLAKSAHQRQLESLISQALNVVSVPESERNEVVNIQRQAAQNGEQISLRTARSIYEMQRKINELEARPPATTPVGTGVRPAAVPETTNGAWTPDRYEKEMREATPEKRDELYRLFRDGKLRLQ